MNRSDSFSLIEVLIFTAVLSLFLVIAASVVTTTLRATRINQNKIKATHYAEELVEWLQSEKEINWGGMLYKSGDTITTFTQQVTQSRTDFCFNVSPISTWPLNTGASNCGFDLNGFRRIATFSATLMEPTPTPPGVGDPYVKEVSVDVSVEWKDGSSLYRVPLQTVFSIWE